jgi:hypothetical protein
MNSSTQSWSQIFLEKFITKSFVTSRWGPSTFPLVQTGHETFASSGFPVGFDYSTGCCWRLMKPSRSAPANRIIRCRHLLSPVHDLACFWSNLPWRTFTLSSSLQAGVWLLRRLRPLSRPLAFSRPCRVKRCQSSPVPSEVNCPRKSGVEEKAVH